jgi:hypothetical protein
MKRILIAALGLSASLLAAPAAQATTADTIHGGCFDDTVSGPSNDGVATGVIGDLSVTTDSSGALIGATVTCWIEVDGAEAPNTRFSYSGPGVQAGSNPISYTSSSADRVTTCQAVAYADGSSEASCTPVTVVPIAPPECCDLVGTVFEILATYVDPAACPALAGLAGSYPGGITIGPDGDVYVPDPLGLGVNPIYDCPPYRNY